MGERSRGGTGVPRGQPAQPGKDAPGTLQEECLQEDLRGSGGAVQRWWKNLEIQTRWRKMVVNSRKEVRGEGNMIIDTDMTRLLGTQH